VGGRVPFPCSCSWLDSSVGICSELGENFGSSSFVVVGLGLVYSGTVRMQLDVILKWPGE
jgi:hypothetical protein